MSEVFVMGHKGLSRWDVILSGGTKQNEITVKIGLMWTVLYGK